MPGSGPGLGDAEYDEERRDNRFLDAFEHCSWRGCWDQEELRESAVRDLLGEDVARALSAVEAFVEDIRRWAFGCGLRASLRDLRVALTTSVANINFSLDDKGMLVSSKTSTATATVTLVFGVVLGGACVRELAVTVTDLALLSFEFSLRGNGF